MYLALPGVIAYALFELQGDQVSMMDEAYPRLRSAGCSGSADGLLRSRNARCDPVLVQLGAELGSTMFTVDIYKEFIDKDASEEKLVEVGKNVGIIFAVLTTIVGPPDLLLPGRL